MRRAIFLTAGPWLALAGLGCLLTHFSADAILLTASWALFAGVVAGGLISGVAALFRRGTQ